MAACLIQHPAFSRHRLAHSVIGRGGWEQTLPFLWPAPFPTAPPLPLRRCQVWVHAAVDSFQDGK